MNVREFIQQHQKTATGIAIVILAAAIVWIVLQNRGAAPTALSTGFYSGDDGTSYVGGDSRQARELQGRNPPLYKASVYRDEGGEKFVGFLTRLPADSLARYNKAQVDLKDQQAKIGINSKEYEKVLAAFAAEMDAIEATAEVKRPGPASAWVRLGSPEGQDVIANVKSPKGSTNVTQVFP